MIVPLQAFFNSHVSALSKQTVTFVAACQALLVTAYSVALAAHLNS